MSDNIAVCRCTELFRAYDTLREEHSRRMYDLQGASEEGKEALDLLIKEVGVAAWLSWVEGGGLSARAVPSASCLNVRVAT